jgi:DNA-directed RNA polymerase subunit RPC12/RpoP
MSWRFRQSFKILPGLKLNLSKTGLSASIGGAPFTVNLGPRGLYGTASIPGTGIQFRQRLTGESLTHPSGDSYAPTHLEYPDEPQSLPPNTFPEIDSSHQSLKEIRSASTELLTSESLKELKSLIQTAYEEHEDISSQLSKAKQEDSRATRRFKSWDNGFLFKKLFKNAFAIRTTEAEIAGARTSELEEQLRLTTISTQVELAKEQAEPFFRMRDDFTSLAECASIWDVKAEQATDKFRERTIASRSVSRERIKFTLGSCDLIQWEQEVPHLQNANGGDIFLYPGFILYRASKTAFSTIDFHNVKLMVAAVKFHEEDGVPNDSKVIGQTWAKTNKDGSRDKRFADNYQIPIAVYGELTLKSETGLWEEFQFSKPERLVQFVKSWNVFVASFDHKISIRVNQDLPAPSTVDSQNIKSPILVGTDIHFECNSCCQPIEVNSEAVGQEFRCPGCGEKLFVPEIPT